MDNKIKKNIEDSIRLKNNLLDTNYINQLTEIGNVMVDTIKNKRKLIFCGNGGSAADAQHLTAELLVRLKPNVNRASIPAITLAQDLSTITACGNDFGFDFLFERNLKALGQKDDLLICISTSGNSKNLVLAAEYALKVGIKVVGFLGGKGGLLKDKCNYSIIIPSSDTARIQEAHITIGHALMEYLEDNLLKLKFISKIS